MGESIAGGSDNYLDSFRGSGQYRRDFLAMNLSWCHDTDDGLCSYGVASLGNSLGDTELISISGEVNILPRFSI